MLRSTMGHVVGYLIFFAVAVGVAFGVAFIIDGQILNFIREDMEYVQFVGWSNFNRAVYLGIGLAEGLVTLLCLFNCSSKHPKADYRKKRTGWIIVFFAINLVVGAIGAAIAAMFNSWVLENLIFVHLGFTAIISVLLCIILFIVLVFCDHIFEW